MTLCQKRFATFGFLAACFSLACGCSASNPSEDGDDTNTDYVCEPGTNQYCFCPDGKTGIQDCKADGSGWEECVCGDDTDTETDTDSDADTDTDTDSDTDTDTVDYCYELAFLAPSSWGAVITEANDDSDPNTDWVQYSAVVQPSDPLDGTEICLYLDRAEQPDPVDCIEPDEDNPLVFPVSLGQGGHLLEAEVEPAEDSAFFECAPKKISATVWENPSCLISDPELSEQSAAPTFWNKSSADFDIATDGASAELWVGGLNKGEETAVSGVVAFDSVALGQDDEGIVVRARCYNAGSGTGDTWSPNYYMSKDTTPPEVDIVAISPEIPVGQNGVRGVGECPMIFTVSATDVDPGQEICAAYAGDTPDTPGCATIAAGITEYDLTVDCKEGLDLIVRAYVADIHENLGEDQAAVSANLSVPQIVIKSPEENVVYNKSTDVLNAQTVAFEHIITACADRDYDEEDISLAIRNVTKSIQENVTGINPTITNESCEAGGSTLDYTITFDTFAFGQSALGIQTEYLVTVEISNGINKGSDSADFYTDTVAPLLAFNQPTQSFFTILDDTDCGATVNDLEVKAWVNVTGLESGLDVNLDVEPGVYSGTLQSSGYAINTLKFGNVLASCGVERYVVLAEGTNTFTAEAADAAGNQATQQKFVLYNRNGVITFPEINRVLLPEDDCDSPPFIEGDPSYDFKIDARVTSTNGTELDFTISSSAGDWSVDANESVSGCASYPCDLTFCVPIPTANDIEQTDIQVSMAIGGDDPVVGPTGVTIEVSPPEAPTVYPYDVTKRRAAEFVLTWDEVLDPQSGEIEQWEIQCLDVTFLEESADISDYWDDASAMVFTEPTHDEVAGKWHLTVPAAGDSVLIRAGHSYSCGIIAVNSNGIESEIAVFGDDNSIPSDGDWVDVGDDLYVDDDDIGFLSYATVIKGYSRIAYDMWLWPSISAAGDLDKNGFDDLLVGYAHSSNAGYWPFGDMDGNAAALYHGSSTGPGSPAVITCDGDESFGGALAGIGDFNGDTYPDMAISSPTLETVYVFFGGVGFGRGGVAGGPPQSFTCDDADIVISGKAGNNLFGNVITPIGDFDNDGFADMAVAAPYELGDGAISDGAVYVVFGRDDGVSTIDISQAGVAGSNVNGTLYIPGKSGSDLAAGGGLAGAKFESTGDYTDLVIAQPWGDSDGIPSEVNIVRGWNVDRSTKANDLITVDLYDDDAAPEVITLVQEGTGSDFYGLMGLAVVDFDEDGEMDLAVGANLSEVGGPGDSGDVYVYLNDGNGNFSNPRDNYIRGTVANDNFGLPVSQMYDFTQGYDSSSGRIPDPSPWKLNGLNDSLRDQAVFSGASQQNAAGRGFAALWYTGVWDDEIYKMTDKVDPDDTNIYDYLFVTPDDAVSHFWTAFVGDLNNDGWVDLAVGDPGYSETIIDTTYYGRIYIYY